MRTSLYTFFAILTLSNSAVSGQAISSVSFINSPQECETTLLVVSGDMGFSGLSVGSILVTDMGSTQEVSIAINGSAGSAGPNPFSVTANLGLLAEGNYALIVQLVGALFEVNTSNFDVNYCCSNEVPTGLVSSTTSSGVQLTWDAVPNSSICQASGRPLGGPAAFIKGPLIQGDEPTSAFIPLGAVPSGTYEWRVACACFTPFSSLDLFTMPISRVGVGESLEKKGIPMLTR